MVEVEGERGRRSDEKRSSYIENLDRGPDRGNRGKELLRAEKSLERPVERMDRRVWTS